MTFASFKSPRVQEAIDRLAGADHLAVFVGAGVSAEAGLPLWSKLVEELLHKASKRVHHFLTEDQQLEWVTRTMRTEQPPGAAGIAQALLGADLATILAQELFRRPGDKKPLSAAAFVPGPTAHAVAALRVACNRAPSVHSPMKIFTTNYDNLIEQAFYARSDVDRRDIVPIVWPRKRLRLGPNHIKIYHLHGYFNGKRPEGMITLTDTAYIQDNEDMRTRDSEVLEVLAKSSCLFLGTSFTDPNIIRYIWASARERRLRGIDVSAEPDRQHVALFTHHTSDPPEIQRAREDIVRARLHDSFTDIVFLDHYADVSQFVYDVRNRLMERDYVPHAQRACGVLRPILRDVIHPTQHQLFDKAQEPLNRRLSQILQKATRQIDSIAGSELRKERTALALWLLDEDGRHLTPWATSDRVHRDPRLLQSVDVAPDTRWIAVRAVCEAKWLDDAQEDYDSRWAYVVGFPLLVDDGLRGRVCIGALSVTTLTPSDDTWLRLLSPEHKRQFSAMLNDDVSLWLIHAQNP